jgi:mannitol/fructose-specific phosphotransferase system IIA component
MTDFTKRQKSRTEKQRTANKWYSACGFQLTNGIVHAGFRGFQRSVARKKSWCKLIGNRLVIPHDTIPSNVSGKAKKTRMT